MINRIDCDLFTNIVAKRAILRHGALQVEIAGMNHYVRCDERECGMFKGYLLREPSNRYDKNAIMICKEDGTQVGYVPRKVNVDLDGMIGKGKVPCTINILGIMMGNDFINIGGLCLIEEYDKVKAERMFAKKTTKKWEDPWNELRRSNEKGSFIVEVRVVDPNDKEQIFSLPKVDSLNVAMQKLDELMGIFSMMKDKRDQAVSDSYSKLQKHRISAAEHEQLVSSMWYVSATFHYKDRIIGDGFMVKKESLEALYGDLTTLAQRFAKPTPKEVDYDDELDEDGNDLYWGEEDEDLYDNEHLYRRIFGSSFKDRMGVHLEDEESSEYDYDDDYPSSRASKHTSSWADEISRHSSTKERNITNDGFTLETFEKSIEDDEYFDFKW